MLILSLLALGFALATAVARPRWMPDALAASLAAAVLIAVGAISTRTARDTIGDLAPTVGFLAALLVLADGCRRTGLFEAIGTLLDDAARALGRPAETVALRGHVEHIVVEAALDADLLVLARDGDRARPGPHSLGHAARFVVDHVACRVLLVWPD